MAHHTKHFLIAAAAGIAALAGITVASLIASGSSGATFRVSVASDASAGEANGLSMAPSISADGRFAVFMSGANNLVVGDTNAVNDIFLRDGLGMVTKRISVASDGAQANASSSYHPAISADGRFVAFESSASNLVLGDTNGVSDIFVKDRLTNATERVSVSTSGAQSSINSYVPAISADGRFVGFEASSGLAPGDTCRSGAGQCWEVFVHDRDTSVTERVSIDPSGHAMPYSGVNGISLSADGRFVAFDDFSDYPFPGCCNHNVYVRDRLLGATEVASVSMSGDQGCCYSNSPSISGDGRFVSFYSSAPNLVPNDTNVCGGGSLGECPDVFVRDRTASTTQRVSVDDQGNQGDGASLINAMSQDGRFVAFASSASNLVPGDTNTCSATPSCNDIFLHDLLTGTTERISIDGNGGQANEYSSYPAVSADGRFVAFQSGASNLAAGDTNGVEDVYVRDRGLPIADTATPTTTTPPTQTTTDTPTPTMTSAPVSTPTATATPCADTDCDGIPNTGDNCPITANTDQRNTNGEPLLLPKPDPKWNDATNPAADAEGDACDPDIDGDSVPNATETAMGLSPYVSDTDGDRSNDGTEIACGSDPLNAASTLPGIDTDHDGLPDACEAIYQTNPSMTDTDGDGVSDGVEVRYWLTGPLVRNTDGDGCNDGKEIATVNGDRVVNSIDLAILASVFNQPTGTLRPYDQNGDGIINSIDLALAASLFGPC